MNISSGLRVLAVIAPLGLASCVGRLLEPEGDLGVGPGAGGGASRAGNGAGAGAGSGAGAGAGGESGGATTPPYEPLKCVTKAVGTSPLRRLTHTEYDNAVSELLGDQTRPAQSFPLDTEAGLFDNTASSQTVPELLADKYIEAAAELAERVVNVTALTGCDVAASTAANCVRTWVASFARKAYRRPLANDEVTGFVSIFENAKAQADATTGVRAVIAAVLASPHFLFRPEFGDGTPSVGGATRLTQFEIGARLASLIWASLPDDVLLDAAAAGGLSTPDQIATQARRMLADRRAQPAMLAFYDQWLGLRMLETTNKDLAIFPAFDDTLKNSMREETRRFVSSVLWEKGGSLASLFTSNESFVNGPLAALYGVSGPADANTFAKVLLNPQERAGILTQASMLASFARPDESSPVKRGKWVRVRLLCQNLPDPPADIPPLPPPREGTSTRERFAEHTSNVGCSGCHSMIDGIGFGLEQFDGMGRVRTIDRGVDVDTRGEMTKTGEIDQAFSGGVELAALLAKSARARDCVATQWLRYSMGREEEKDDTCSLVAAREKYRESGGDLRELVIALTQTDGFLNYKRP
jgi:hypothetical protein